ncbi:hypothetical protein [Paenibacillus sp. y28]|uniref:hypothetical protein n=1 Tax=Paenibacillus sp. y28 TaxID=3129110 RepID=UPI0030167C64
MSLKLVELQIAIPKTQEIGTIQQNQSNKLIHDQAAMASASMKTSEEQRSKPMEVNASPEANIQSKQQSEQDKQRKGRNKQTAANLDAVEETNVHVPSVHPYKGKHVDLTV